MTEKDGASRRTKKIFIELIVLVFLVLFLSTVLFVKAYGGSSVSARASSMPAINDVSSNGEKTSDRPTSFKSDGLNNSTNSTSSEPIPELSWIDGNSFPEVNGDTVFPPVAPPMVPSPAYSTHWYAGSVYPRSSPTQNAFSINMSIRVPYSLPLSDEFYYVLLSAWDSNGSYDQIGFSDINGNWGLTYSWTTGSPSNLTFHFLPEAMTLSLGATYTFYITTESGVTHFVAYQDSTPVWSLDAPTGGNYLILSNTYSGYLGYANYEEVWETHNSGGSPAFDFFLSNNCWVSQTGIGSAAIWSSYYSEAPGNVAVVISGNSVLVNNPVGTVMFETNPTSFAASPGTISFSTFDYSNDQAGVFADSNYLAIANAPTEYQFDHWEYSGSNGNGVYVSNMNANPVTVQVFGDGFLNAIFSAKITFYTNTLNDGSITWGNGPSYTYGQNRWENDLPPNSGNTVSITANPPAQYNFGSWSITGMLSVIDSLSNPTTLIVNGPGTVTANFVALQNQVTFNYQVFGGGSGYSAPSVSYVSLGVPQTVTAGPTASVWADFGSTYTYSTNLLTGSGASERWYTLSGTSGTISTSTTINPTYYHQYFITFGYGDQDSSVITGSGQMGSYVQFGSWFALNSGSDYGVTSPVSGWVDAGSSVMYNSPISGIAGERWIIASGDNGIHTAIGSVSSSVSATVFYYHQFYLSNNLIANSVASITASPTTDSWYNSGSTISLVLNYNWNVVSSQSRNNLFSYTIDGLTTNVIRSGSGTYSVPTISVTTSHTVNDMGQTQYLLTVSGGNGLSYGVVSPTSDNWYDSGTSTTVSTNWVWNTVPTQSQTILSNYVIDGVNQNPARQTSGTLTSTSLSMSTYHTVAFTSVTQYYLSISSLYGSPTGQGWFDTGSSVNFRVTTPISGGAGTQYVFMSWSGTGSGSYTGSSNSQIVIMNSAIAETANWQTQYQVSFINSPAGGGTTTPSGTNTWQNTGAAISITASPNSGYSFSSWASTGSITVNQPSIITATATIDGPGTITANFQTPSPTPTPTPVSTPTPTPVSTPTPTPVSTSTPTPGSSPAPPLTPTPSPSPTVTPTPASSSTATSTIPTGAPNPTPGPTETPPSPNQTQPPSIPQGAIYGITAVIVIVAIVGVVLVLRKSKKSKN